MEETPEPTVSGSLVKDEMFLMQRDLDWFTFENRIRKLISKIVGIKT